jgi:hypothetical protein
MKHNFFEGPKFNDISAIHFDLAIFACGYEQRSSYVITQSIIFKSAVCFAFENEDSDEFKKNLEVYNSKLVPVVKQSAHSNEKILGYLKHFFEKPNKKNINILVDYSSMSRIWYASIIFFLKYLKREAEIELFFLYSIPKFEQTNNDPEHIIYEPVEYISQLTIPDKPTALIISLGDTARQAKGLKEYFDAEEVYCYYSDSKYKNVILDINKSLIEALPTNKVIAFPLRDVAYTKFLLESLCRELLETYRIVIAPCGPKTFTLASFFVSDSLSKIDVWRISKPNKVQEKKAPSGEVICLKISYCAD